MSLLSGFITAIFYNWHMNKVIIIIIIYESSKRFWIVGVQNMAKKVTGKCPTCKKSQSQIMSQILRLNIAAGLPVFSNTAIDMFGPLQIRINRKTLKEAQEIIFTCKSGPSRACNRQLIYGFSEICLTQMISQ